MFTQPCFIRNARKELSFNVAALGYTPMFQLFRNNIEGNNLVLEVGTWHFTDSDNHPDSIDCGTNEDLFLAIAALRDDTDKNQWFVIDVEAYVDIRKGDWFKATDINGQYHVGAKIDPLYCHKATIEELIEHFNGLKNRR